MLRKSNTTTIIGALLIFVIAALPLMSACAPAATPSPTAKPAPTTAPASPAPSLPKVITIATLGTGSAKYVQAVAFRQAVEKYTPMSMRIIPGSGFSERAGAVIKGDAEFTHLGATDCIDWANGIGQAEAFGPQPVRWVWRGEGGNNALAARGNAGFKTIADLKGKRLPEFKASKGWNDEMAAFLAFGGVNLKDMELVTVSSIADGQGAIIDGRVDVASISVFGAQATELAASRFGIKWFSMPATDTEGWKRQNAIMPYKSPKYREAAGLKAGEKIWTADSGPGGINSMSTVSEDVVYEFCKAMHKGYIDYSAISKEMSDWTLELAYDLGAMETVGIPYHDGTVRFFKQLGVWSPAHEAMQQKTLAMEKERLSKKK